MAKKGRSKRRRTASRAYWWEWCPAHRPRASERMREIGWKGAEAARKLLEAGGIDVAELGALETIR